MSVRLLRRAATLGAALAVPLGLIGAAPALSSAAPAYGGGAARAMSAPSATVATATPATSKSHPYSDPRYYPLAVEAQLDCVHSNPGCRNPHASWSMDQTPTMQWKYGPSQARVLAMGAGVLHIKNAHGTACGHGSNFGTEVWVDHGGGVVTRYGHLSKILVKAGHLVAAGQPLGIVGDTGKNVNCGRVNYTDYGVVHHGYGGVGVQITTLKACASSTKSVDYPGAVTRWAVWNQVHQGTIIRKPAGGTACLPKAVPPTAPVAGSVSLRRPSSGVLTLTWARPGARYRVNSVLVEVSAYHSSAQRWDSTVSERWVGVTANHVSYTARGLRVGTTYRLRVEFHNAAGWSRYGAWVTHRA